MFTGTSRTRRSRSPSRMTPSLRGRDAMTFTGEGTHGKRSRGAAGAYAYDYRWGPGRSPSPRDGTWSAKPASSLRDRGDLHLRPGAVALTVSIAPLAPAHDGLDRRSASSRTRSSSFRPPLHTHAPAVAPRFLWRHGRDYGLTGPRPRTARMWVSSFTE